MSKRNELIFWFDQPPHVSKGAFNYVSEHWGNKVIFIADHEFPEHRKLIGWDDAQYGAAEMVYLSKQENPDEYIRNIFEKYPNAVHIMNGFFSTIESKISPYVKKAGIKLAVHSEKPLVPRRGYSFKKWLRKTLIPIKYKKKYLEYKDYVAAVIPLGVWGKELFEESGWPQDKVFSFMYCPILKTLSLDGDVQMNDPMRFLYVGRLNYSTRALDVLMKSFEGLPTDSWHLDLVGGYGDKRDEVFAWAEKQKNVSILGVWPAHEVGIRMKDYDIYVTPTKVDGWNSQLNEALNAGISVITTNEAVSDEMIIAANAGMVVSAYSVSEFKTAVKTAIKKPEMVAQWKMNAKNYRHRIQCDVVGEYFMDILDYTFYNKTEKPQCPWLNIENENGD